MKKTLKLCVVAIALALTLALVSCFVNGTTNTYTITYIDAPSHNNPTTYTSNDYIKLQKPVWTGLAFSHWSDENGNVVKEIPRGTNGNITLTANWMYTENMIVSNDSNEMLFSLYDEEHNQRYFVYEIGTMHNVVLDELSAYKYNGATNHTWSISETVSFTESSAYDVAKTIADSVTDSTSWSDTHTDLENNSTNKHQTFTLAPEVGVGPVKVKLGEYSNGKETLDSKGSSDEHYDGGGKDTTHEESKAVSSSISYIKDVTTQVTRTETLDPSITPAGMYRYVQAGSIKVYAIVTYNQDTKDYYINIYSYIDQIYETMLYEPVPEYNNDINIVDCAPFTFDLNIDELAENVIGNAYYVEFNANGGIGSMPTQMILPNSSAKLFDNQFTREGYEFIGWSLVANDTGIIYSDGQIVNSIANSQETITLYAVWVPVSYKIVYDANGGTGIMQSTTYLINREDKLPANAFKKFDYIFVGWNTKADGTGVYFEDEALIKDLVSAGETVSLYAIWGSNGLEYTLNDDNSSYSVTGIGTCTDTNIIIPSVYNGLPVTSIGYAAFRSCDSLTSVVIPESITVIETDAFNKCSSLASISIPNSVTTIVATAFRACTALSSVIFGENSKLTSISNWVFDNCTSLTSIEIPNSVTSIGSGAFNYCTSLTNVTIGDSVSTIQSNAFVGCGTLISIHVDENNKHFKSIDENLYSEDGKTLILYAIGKQDVSFTIPDFVTNVSNAFQTCTSLTSVTIPDSVTSISNNAFSGCTSLNDVVFGKNIQLSSIDGFKSCTSLKSINIPDSVTSIGKYAFENCTSLISINIPDTVTSIGAYAFKNCTSLTSISIPYSVTSIGAYAFDNCTSLKSVFFNKTSGWWISIRESATSGTSIPETDLKNPAIAAEDLSDYKSQFYWRCNK